MHKFAFIGCGNVARYHADTVLALGHKIIGVCGRPHSKNIKGFKERYRVNGLYTDWRQLIATEKPDAVVVAVSEENGSISYAYRGELVRGLTLEELRAFLTSVLIKRGKSRGLVEWFRSLTIDRAKSEAVAAAVSKGK